MSHELHSDLLIFCLTIVSFTVKGAVVVPRNNCEFVYFSFQLYQFLLYVLETLLSGAYSFRIAMFSC